MFIDVIRDISSRFPSRLKHYLKHFQVAYKFSPETFTIYPGTTRKECSFLKGIISQFIISLAYSFGKLYVP